MTKKDYIKIAAALATVQPPYPSAAQEVWQRTVYAIAAVLSEDNGKFDRERFLKAAGAL